MKTEKANSKKKSRKAAPSHCGDFQKMAEMMKTCCPSQGDGFDCCSFMRRMMDQGWGAQARETKERQKSSEGGEKS